MMPRPNSPTGEQHPGPPGRRLGPDPPDADGQRGERHDGQQEEPQDDLVGGRRARARASEAPGAERPSAGCRRSRPTTVARERASAAQLEHRVEHHALDRVPGTGGGELDEIRQQPRSEPRAKASHRDAAEAPEHAAETEGDAEDEVGPEQQRQPGQQSRRRAAASGRACRRPAAVVEALGDAPRARSPTISPARPRATAPFQASAVSPIAVSEMSTPMSPAAVATLRPHGRARTKTPKMIPSSCSIPKNALATPG